MKMSLVGENTMMESLLADLLTFEDLQDVRRLKTCNFSSNLQRKAFGQLPSAIHGTLSSALSWRSNGVRKSTRTANVGGSSDCVGEGTIVNVDGKKRSV